MGYLGNGPGIRTVLLIRHKSVGLSYVRTLLMSNPLRISCARYLDYMVGQYSPLTRKSIEPMALAVEGGRVRSLQRFLSETGWDEEQMRWNYHQLVADELGEPDGVLMFDESGFVKKGNDSAGVARKYCGTLGKVENCQVGVFAGYASRQGYALVEQRLFLPEV